MCIRDRDDEPYRLMIIDTLMTVSYTHLDVYKRQGLPDIIVCAEGKFVGLETKMPSQRYNTSVQQRLVHEKIRDAGGHCYVVCSSREALRLVEELLEGPLVS